MTTPNVGDCRVVKTPDSHWLTQLEMWTGEEWLLLEPPKDLTMAPMKPNTRAILERCIEDGASHGVRRAHKHVEKPSDGAIADAVVDAIWLEIDTYFNFEEPTP